MLKFKGMYKSKNGKLKEGLRQQFLCQSRRRTAISSNDHMRNMYTMVKFGKIQSWKPCACVERFNPHSQYVDIHKWHTSFKCKHLCLVEVGCCFWSTHLSKHCYADQTAPTMYRVEVSSCQWWAQTPNLLTLTRIPPQENSANDWAAQAFHLHIAEVHIFLSRK